MHALILEHELFLNQLIFESLLTENARFDFLVKTYGEKIEQKYVSTKASEPPVLIDDIDKTEGNTNAERLIRYMSKFDPTPKQQYSQWLVVRWLKNGIKLEDLEAIRDMLAIFTEVKNQLQKRDINQYRDKDDLEAAVNPFMVSNAAAMPEDEKVRQRMLQADQTTVLYDGPEMRVLVPHTKESAAYWGCTTDWCTTWGMPGTKYPERRDNYYERYASQGPLYIITTKKDGALYQFHFETEQFMDSRDRQIDVKKFLGEYPRFLQLIEPKHVERLMQRRYIPLASIPREIAKDLSPSEALRLVQNDDDVDLFLTLFPHAVENSYTMRELIGRDVKHLAIVADVLKNDPDFWEALVNGNPAVFKELPAQFQTQQLAHVIAVQFHGWRQIDEFIPKTFWDDEIKERYYGSKMLDPSVPLRDIPEQYYHETSVARKLAERPDDLVEYQDKSIFTHDVMERVLRKQYTLALLIDTKKFDSELAKYVFEKSKATQTYGEARMHFSAPYRSNVGVHALYLGEWIASLPKEALDDEMVAYAVKHRRMSFKDIPESLRTDTVIKQLLDDTKNFATLPEEYITPERIVTKIDYANFKDLPEKYLSEDIVLKIVTKTEYAAERLYQQVPDRFKTPKVKLAFAKKRALPIKDFPQEFLREDLITARIQNNADEINDIPSSAMTNDLVAKIAETNPSALVKLENRKKFLNRAVLRRFMAGAQNQRSSMYGRFWTELQETFKLFDQSQWDSDILAAGLSLHWIPDEFDSVPTNLVTDKVASIIIARNPSEVTKSPIEVSEDVLVEAAKNVPNFIVEIDPAFLTDEVVYTALKDAVLANQMHWRKDKFRALPRDKWTGKTFKEAVGRFLDLKEVPPKFRKPDLVEVAVMRDAKNIQALKDPVGYFKKHNIVFQHKDTLEALRNQGIIFQKKGKDIETFTASEIDEQYPLNDNTTYTYRDLGKVNTEYFLMDKKGRVLMRLFTKSGRLHRKDAVDKSTLIKHRDGVIGFLNVLKNTNTDDFSDLGIYRRTHRFMTQFNYWKDLPKEQFGRSDIKLQISTGLDGEGQPLYVIWNGEKPALTVKQDQSSGGFGNSGKNYIKQVSILDSAFIVKNRGILFDWAKSKFQFMGFGASELAKLGMISKRDGGLDYALGEKIAKVGDFTVFSSMNRLALFHHKHGVVAHAVVRKSGALDKLTLVERYTAHSAKMEQAVRNVFGEIEKLMHDRRQNEIKKEKEAQRQRR